MKATTRVLLCGLAALSMVLPSCTKGNDPFAMIDLIPVKTSEDGKWSMINDKGEIVYDSEFKNAPSPSFNGVFFVEEKEGIALYRSGGKEPELIKGCDGLKSAGIYNEGIIPVAFPKSRITLINDKGDKKAELTPVSGHEIVKSQNSFFEGRLLVITDEDKRGYVDKSGSTVIAPTYDRAASFNEGVALVGIKKEKANADSSEYEILTDEDFTWSVIDKKGDKQFALKDGITPLAAVFENGRLFVRKGENQFGYLDKKGEFTKLPSKIKGLTNYNDKYIAYEDNNDQYGVMDYNGETVIRAKYDGMYITGKYFLAKQDNKWRVLDKEGEEVEGFDRYDDISYLGHFGYLIDEGGKTKTLIDNKGKAKGKEEFYEFGGNYPDMVESDYFDVDGIVSTIVEMVSEQGVGKYTLGAIPGQILGGNPDDHLYTSQITFEDIAKKGYGYTISFQGLFSSNVADYDFDYNFNRNSYWKSDSKLIMIGIEVKTEKEFGLDGYKALVKGFEGKGYKTLKASDTSGDKFATLFKKGNSLVLVAGEKKATAAYVSVIDGTIPGIEDNMKTQVDTIAASKSDSSDYAVEDSVATVEEVAVAEDDYGYGDTTVTAVEY